MASYLHAPSCVHNPVSITSATCGISGQSLLSRCNDHVRKAKYPYPVAIAHIDSNQFYFDAAHLHQYLKEHPHFASQTGTKVHYLMTRNGTDFTHLHICSGDDHNKTEPCIKARQLVVACQLGMSEESLDAKTTLVHNLLHQKDYKAAYAFLEQAIIDFPDDSFFNRKLGFLLCKGLGCEKNERRGEKLVSKAFFHEIKKLGISLLTFGATSILPNPCSYVLLAGSLVVKLLPQKKRTFSKATTSSISLGNSVNFIAKFGVQLFKDGLSTLKNKFFYGNLAASVISMALTVKDSSCACNIKDELSIFKKALSRPT